MTTAANVTLPTTNTPASRVARGRFALGNAGGPGRPPRIAHIEREVLASMATVLSPEVWVRITQAMAYQALEGSVAAANWLTRTFMQGGLSKAAAAEAVGITAEAEMLVLGKAQHPEWAKLLDERMAEERERAAALPALPTQPAAAIPQVTMSAPLTDPAGAQREPSQGGYALEKETVETVETVKTVETVEAETEKTVEGPPVAAAEGSAPSVALTDSRAAAPPQLTVPPAERVWGFRVTKGPRPPENGRNRGNRHLRVPPGSPIGAGQATSGT